MRLADVFDEPGRTGASTGEDGSSKRATWRPAIVYLAVTERYEAGRYELDI